MYLENKKTFPGLFYFFRYSSFHLKHDMKAEKKTSDSFMQKNKNF